MVSVCFPLVLPPKQPFYPAASETCYRGTSISSRTGNSKGKQTRNRKSNRAYLKGSVIWEAR